MAGTLTVVATPIGNLGDISQRVTLALGDASRILAEDTRRTRALLAHLGIAGKAIERLDAKMEARTLSRWLEQLAAGESLALVSDAGTPTVSDPGAVLILEAIRQGHQVSALPGPSAVTTAIAASGFPGDRFRFFGFLPRGGSARQQALAEVMRTEEVAVFFEAPTRMATTLEHLASRMPERALVVAREMTKLHEEFIRGSCSEVFERDAQRQWKGEITVVLGPFAQLAERTSETALDERLDELLAQHMRSRDVAKALAIESGWSAREIYARISARKRQRDD